MKKLLPILLIGLISFAFVGKEEVGKEPIDYCARDEAKTLAKSALKPYRYAGVNSKPFLH